MLKTRNCLLVEGFMFVIIQSWTISLEWSIKTQECTSKEIVQSLILTSDVTSQPILFSLIWTCVKVALRFPTLEHLIEAGLLTSKVSIFILDISCQGILDILSGNTRYLVREYYISCQGILDILSGNTRYLVREY